MRDGIRLASDIYALGVVLQEIAPPNAGSRWNKVVERCLQEDPARRFASADDLSRALLPKSRRWFIASGAAGVLAMFSGVVTYQTTVTPAENVRLALLPVQGGQDFASDPNEVAQLAPNSAPATKILIISNAS